jgi:hypothetical protein
MSIDFDEISKTNKNDIIIRWKTASIYIYIMYHTNVRIGYWMLLMFTVT